MGINRMNFFILTMLNANPTNLFILCQGDIQSMNVPFFYALKPGERTSNYSFYLCTKFYGDG